MIDIGVDIIHPKPITAVAFPAGVIVRTLARHGEAIRGIQEHLLGVPIQEELTTLRFRVDIDEVENALLYARIRIMEAVENVTHNHERPAHEKSLWEEIKNRFGGNKESKKMQKTILKQNYENFAVSSQEGLDKTYDMFQKLISQLEIHDNSSSTNETVNTAHSVSAASSKDQASTASYIDDDDLEEMDHKWQVAMLTMRVKRFIKKKGRKLDLNGKETIVFDRTKVECYNYYRRVHFAREYKAPRNQENRNRDAPRRNAPEDTSTTNDLVVQDGIGSSTSLSSDSEVHTCSKECLKSYEALQKQYGQQHETLNKSNLEILGYQIGLESLEASAKDKIGLGYDGQMKESDLNDIHVNESEVLDNVFDSRKNNGIDNQVNDRFKMGEGYHVVPPPNTRNYMPPRADLSFAGLDNFVFKSKVSETINSVPKIETNASKTSKDSLEKPKTIRSSTPLIKECESDIEDENVFKPKEVKKTVKPSFKKIDLVNARNTTVENESKAEKPRKFSQSLRGNKRNWNGLMTQRLRDGFEFKKKGCFLCRSFNHLIKDYEFYENKMVEKSVLNNKGNITGAKEIRPVWDNTARVTHQSKLTHPHPKRNFVLVAVLSKSRQVPVNAAKQSSHRAASLVNTARRVNTAAPRPNVNDALPTTFITARVNNVTTARPKVVVSTAKGNRDNDVKSSQCWIWRPKENLIDHISKDSGSYTFKRFDYVDPQGRLKHMTGNKSYLTNYQEIDGGFIAFGGNAKGGKITRKGPKSSKDEVADDAGKKSTEVPRKENGVQDPKKEGDKNDQEKDVRDQEEALRKQFKQEFQRFFGQWEATNTNSTNRLNTISSPVSAVSSSFTTVDPGRERAQRNEFESMFGQDNDANENSTYTMFTPVSAVGSSYVNLGGSIPVNVATLPNADLPTDPLMPDLEDTADLQDTGIFSGAYDDEVEGAVADFNNLELTTILHQIEPKKVIQALTDPRWIKAMQDELLQFRLQKMDVKSAFLYGTIEEEVYVCQPPSFEDSQFPDKVCKVEKALYGLHQAPRVWYETLSTYLLETGFRRGIIDKTLFIKKEKGDLLLVQVYVDDMIFGSTKKSLCTEFEGLMYKKFQMSSMGELTFFLGLQVMQRDDGIFISQDKYVADILKKFDFSSVRTASIPIETNKALLKDEEVEDVDVHLYTSMIRSLMYLTAFRPDIMFDVCACARFQVTPKVLHLYAIKRIFRYLKGQSKLGLWYPRDSPFDLEAFLDSDYAGASLDGKSTTRDGISDEFGVKTDSCNVNAARQDLVLLRQNGNAEFHQIVDFLTTSRIHYAFTIDLAEPFNNVYITPVHTKLRVKVQDNPLNPNHHLHLRHPLMKNKLLLLHHNPKSHTPRQTKRGQDTEIPQSSGPPKKVGDEAIYIGEDDRVVSTATTATGLEAEQESGDADAQTRFETTSKQSYNPPISEVNTSGSREDSMEHQDGLTDFIPPTPHDSPLLGGHAPTAQDLVIQKLQKKVKRLEKKQRGRTLKMNLFKIGDIDDDFDDMVDEVMENVEGVTVNAGGAVNTATTRVSAASASVTTAGVSISTAEPCTPLTTTTTVFEYEDLTITQTLVKMRSEKAKEKGVAFRDVEESARPITILPIINPKDKGKGIMQEPEKPPKNPKKAQIQLDEELAKWMHEEEITELEKRQKKSRMLVEMITERKRFFAAQRVAEQRSKPPTKAQMRNKMCTYLKSQAGYNYNQLKGRMVKDSGKKDDSSSKQARSRKKRAGEDLGYWKITKADGISRFYKVFSTMLEEFNKQDLFNLHRLVMRRVHTLLMDGTLVCINMLVEKKYPLTKEMLTRMLNSRLEADVESTMAFEFIRFIKAHLEG
nr:putative ribonuclease H-like domain-containing protein [Tanacetum cinerariifolium]